MATIHWLGAGLSSGPGIRRLASGPFTLHLWNRTPDKAHAILRGSPGKVDALDLESLAETLKPGDVLVSMLPADWHPTIAKLALRSGAHFVSSSYLSPAMNALHDDAAQKGLCLVNEVGLDPGLDHLMAHRLVGNLRASGLDSTGARVALRSWCGGFPAQANEFCYKFSWSPLGVLRALKTPAQCIQGGEVVQSSKPWEAISRYDMPWGNEQFEAYPNRDSLPFILAYHFDPGWHIEEFVRGTLRLPGWTDAWADIFATLDRGASDEDLARLSEHLWQNYAYAEHEADRVVLCVELEATLADGQQFHEASVIDVVGNEEDSAMARLVSLPVSYAVEDVLNNRMAAGVSAAPADAATIARWFDALAVQGDAVTHRKLA